MGEIHNVLNVDIGSVLGSKNPKLLKVIPKFVIRLMEKLIHQNEINFILENFGHLEGVDFASAALKHLKVCYQVHGLEKINKNRRYIIASNHPLGGLDGIILMEIFGNAFNNEIKFVVNDLLMYIEPLRPIFVPVNKYGRQSVEIATQIHDVYNSNYQILNFPAGLCSRMIGGKIQDLEWKKSFLNQAIKYERDIIPVFFEGKNSGFFYRFANLRKALGIKFNFELILLPHEMFRQKRGKFEIFVGDPIPFEKFSHEGNAATWTDFVRGKVYSLKPKLWNQ
ncbi:MAG: 1-acyl-sn-glycerol-3-phosphate acyltransferase [Bacteroidales bacterium]